MNKFSSHHTVLLVQPDAVHLICEPASYPALIERACGLRNLRVHCRAAGEGEGDDDFKMLSFVKMMQGARAPPLITQIYSVLIT